MGWQRGGFWRGCALVMLGLITSVLPAHGADPVEADVLTIATTESMGEDLIQSVVARLRPTLSNTGGEPPHLIITSSRSKLIDLIDDGAVDLVISDARITVLAMTKNPMVNVMKVVGPSSDLAPVVFAVRKSSPIQSLADLKGRSLAFEGLWNRSGYFAPMIRLMRDGYEMGYLDNVRQAPVPDVINFVFAGDEVNMVAWLDRGFIDALAFNRSDWLNDEETPPHIRDTLRLIAEDDVPMDHFVTLISRDAIRQSEVIRAALVTDRSGKSPFRAMSFREEAQLNFLVETYARAEGNYLAHE